VGVDGEELKRLGCVSRTGRLSVCVLIQNDGSCSCGEYI
jgi:hypothetical protein